MIRIADWLASLFDWLVMSWCDCGVSKCPLCEQWSVHWHGSPQVSWYECDVCGGRSEPERVESEKKPQP